METGCLKDFHYDSSTKVLKVTFRNGYNQTYTGVESLTANILLEKAKKLDMDVASFNKLARNDTKINRV
jgi:hypothetical protein